MVNLSFDTLLLLIIIILIIMMVTFLLFIQRRYMRRQREREEISELLNGRYRIGYKLGRGMNAAAFQVEDRENPSINLVAKVLLTSRDHPGITRGSFRRHLARFQREMNHLEQVKGSKYIVPTHAFYPDALPPFYVMKRCEKSLAEQLSRGPLSIQEVLDAIADILQGLEVIHKKNIIHRDLKPANILWYKGRWVLSDFGMSLLGEERSVVTVQESLPGTIPYTATEVLYSEIVKPSADIFSLGVCLKEMLTTQITRDKRPSELLLNGTDSQTKEEVKYFDEFVTRMTDYNPQYRPQSVRKVAKELREIFVKIDSQRASENLLKNICRLDEIGSKSRLDKNTEQTDEEN
jgi:serine/threonine protein kinase